jgi:dihydrolipoamide dehydrogenase
MVVGDFAIELETVVIGAGPGGYVAAIRAAQTGQKVTIIEREYIGGVCLNVGCIPSKALISAGHAYQNSLDSEIFGITSEKVTLDFAKTQKWKQEEVVEKLTSGVRFLLKKHNVTVVDGEAFFVDEHTLRVLNGESAQTYSFKNAIVATGSRPIELPGFAFKQRVLDSTGALNLAEVPEKLVIIGGGVVGSELGSAYANLGAQVTILEGSDQVLPTYEKDMVKFVEEDFKNKGIEVVTNALAKKAEQDEQTVTVSYEVNGVPEKIVADYVMVTVGRKPNTDNLGLHQAGVNVEKNGLILVDAQGRTNIPSIYAIGDIVPGIALAHKASYEGKIAAEAIAGEAVAVDYQAMPIVAFSDPELATVGYTEAEAKAKNIEVKVIKFPFASNGRALSLGKTEGFIRLVTTGEEKRVIGAQLAGVGASDMVSELALAIEAGMNVKDIALTIHPHPSLGEIIMDASELSLGLAIHF